MYDIYTRCCCFVDRCYEKTDDHIECLVCSKFGSNAIDHISRITAEKFTLPIKTRSIMPMSYVSIHTKPEKNTKDRKSITFIAREPGDGFTVELLETLENIIAPASKSNVHTFHSPFSIKPIHTENKTDNPNTTYLCIGNFHCINTDWELRLNEPPNFYDYEEHLNYGVDPFTYESVSSHSIDLRETEFFKSLSITP